MTSAGQQPFPLPDAGRPPRSRIRALGVLRAAIVLLCCGYIIVYGWIAMNRIAYPYELEWIEGTSVAHIQRVLNGEQLYVAPTVSFVPFVYPPLYHWVSAGVATWTGVGFFAPRLVSFLSSIIAGILLFFLARKETGGSGYWGFIAAGFFFAAYRATGAWYDIARVDSLFIALLLGAVLAFRSDRPMLRSILSPVLFFLAAFTKQSALFIAIPFAIWAVFFRTGRERALFGVVLLVTTGAAAIVMNRITGGWFLYYLFEMPAQHGYSMTMVMYFWREDMFRMAGISWLALAYVLLGGGWKGRWAERSFDLLMAASLIGVSFLFRIHPGGYNNVLIPALVALAVFLARGLSSAMRDSGNRPGLHACLYIAVIIQLCGLVYQPVKQVPTEAARRAGRTFIRAVSEIPGPVYMPAHPWYLVMAGKQSNAHAMTIDDVRRTAETSPVRKSLERSILGAIERRQFGAIILDTHFDFPWEHPLLMERYRLVRDTLTAAAFTPATGFSARPLRLYLPKMH